MSEAEIHVLPTTGLATPQVSRITTRHYNRLVDRWVALIGLDPSAFGTHSLRRTEVALVYKRTGNIRACHLLLGHTKLESTVRYLGIEVDDALISQSRPKSEPGAAVEMAAACQQDGRPQGVE